MAFFYLATPYASHPQGREAAFQQASKTAANLLSAGLKVFCPIAHSHEIDKNMNFKTEKERHDFWLGLDRTHLALSSGVIVAAFIPGWDRSQGIAHEEGYALGLGKPVFRWLGDRTDLRDRIACRLPLGGVIVTVR